MNAKVQIQLPEQLIPYYTAADIIQSYSSAFETTTQIKTLINRIDKATAQIKIFAQEENAECALFSELESLIAITKDLANCQLDTFKLECKRHNESNQDQYDAGDLLDAYSLAFETTSWLETMLSQIKDEACQIKEELEKHGISSAVFTNLEKIISIAEYLAQSQANAFDVEREKYENQWEASKNE